MKGFTPPDGGYGWVVVVAFIVINSSLLTLTQCLGIIYKDMFDQIGVTGAQKSFLLHLNNAIMCSLGLISGPLLKRFNFRQVCFMGASIVCLATFLTTFATTYSMLIFTVGILIGVGLGILNPATYVAIPSYFKRRLTLAISLQVTGASLAQIFMPQVCQLLYNEYGVHGTVLIIAGISFHAIPAIILVRPVPLVKKNSMLPQDDAKKLTWYQEVIDRLDLSLFKDRVYVIIIIGMGVSFVSELNIILMLPFILPDLAGFGIDAVALAMSIQATADVIGRAVVPLVLHRIGVPSKIAYLSSLVISSIGRLILATAYDNKIAVFSASAIIGLAKGIKAVFQSVILPEYISRDKLAGATGLSMMSTGILSLVLGPLIGLSHDYTNSYIWTLHTASLISMFCLVLWGMEYLICMRHERNKEEYEIAAENAQEDKKL